MRWRARANERGSLPIGFLLGIAVGVTGAVVWTSLQLTAPTIFENNYSWVPSSSSESTALARRESLGFFQDVPDSVWKRYKERFQFTQPNYDKRRVENDAKHSQIFWGEHFEPEFTCPFEFRLGKLGDGGKWICDPQRIPDDSCLVYSVGSNGKFQFELAVLEHVSKDCEIHIFDMVKYFRKNGKYHSIPKAAEANDLIFHNWGIGKKYDNMKTFKETIQELHHENKIIDVMKIDCERCEYSQYKQWFEDWDELGMTIRQIMIEIHNSKFPGIVEMMTAFQDAGYVMFHKEANYWNGGNCIEAAFLLLDKDFQKKESPAVQG